MDVWHIQLIGILIQTAIFLLGGYAMVVRTDAAAKSLKEDVVDMRDELKKLAEVITTQAVQTERIDNLTALVTMLQRNVEDLRRGNGFVTGRAGLNGEYP